MAKAPKLKTKRQPMQPMEWDGDGVLRFKENPIVRYMLDHQGYALNTLHRVLVVGQPAPNSQTVVTQSDWDQLNQLIGYSVSGCPLSRKASRRAARKADAYMAAHPKDPALCGEVVRE